MTLKALVAKWRGYGEDTRFGHSVYEDCAEELEALLTAPSAETPRGEEEDRRTLTELYGPNWHGLPAGHPALQRPKPADVGKAGASESTETGCVEETWKTVPAMLEVVRDAERYRWLRSKDVGPYEMRTLFETVNDECNPPYRELRYEQYLDAAIDAARASKPNAGKESDSIPLHPKALAAVVPPDFDSVTLTGGELLSAIELVVPDVDADQLETECVIQYLKEGHSGPGNYLWLAEYPEEGSTKLETRVSRTTPPITPQDKAAPSTLDAGTDGVRDDAKTQPVKLARNLLIGCRRLITGRVARGNEEAQALQEAIDAWLKFYFSITPAASTQNAERTTAPSRFNKICTHDDPTWCDETCNAKAGNQTDGGEYGDFDKLLAELKRDDPEGYAAAQQWVREKFYGALPADAHVGEARTAD